MKLEQSARTRTSSSSLLWSVPKPCKQLQKISRIYGHAQELLTCLQTEPTKITHIMLSFGYTQVGSTTACHYLTHRVLRSKLNQFGKAYYQIAHQKLSQGMNIGAKRGASQTQGVNLFQTDLQIKGQSQNCSLYLADSPGISVEDPINNSLGNNLYKHIIFERVNNIKFIIMFRYADMGQTAQIMLRTFTQFFKMFNNIQQILQQLIPSICVLVIDTPQNMTRQQVKLQFAQTPAFPKKSPYFQAYSQLKQTLINHKNVYIFPSALITKPTADPLDETLKEMHQNTVFWNRNLLPGYKICMNNLKCIREILIKDNELNTQQYSQIDKFYIEVFKQKIQSFKKILIPFLQNSLQCTTAQTQMDNNKIITMMRQKGEQYYNKNILSLNRSVSQVNKRQKWMKNMFDKYCRKFIKNQQILKKFGVATQNMFSLHKMQVLGRIDQLIIHQQDSKYKQLLLDMINQLIGMLYNLISVNSINNINNNNSNNQYINYQQYYLYELYCSIYFTYVWLNRQNYDSKQIKINKLGNLLCFAYFTQDIKMILHQIYKQPQIQLFVKSMNLSMPTWMAIIQNMSGIKTKFMLFINEQKQAKYQNYNQDQDQDQYQYQYYDDNQNRGNKIDNKTQPMTYKYQMQQIYNMLQLLNRRNKMKDNNKTMQKNISNISTRSVFIPQND